MILAADELNERQRRFNWHPPRRVGRDFDSIVVERSWINQFLSLVAAEG